jgi:hypothetical protein
MAWYLVKFRDNFTLFSCTEGILNWEHVEIYQVHSLLHPVICAPHSTAPWKRFLLFGNHFDRDRWPSFT